MTERSLPAWFQVWTPVIVKIELNYQDVPMRSGSLSENGPQAMEDIEVKVDYASRIKLGAHVWWVIFNVLKKHLIDFPCRFEDIEEDPMNHRSSHFSAWVNEHFKQDDSVSPHVDITRFLWLSLVMNRKLDF